MPSNELNELMQKIDSELKWSSLDAYTREILKKLLKLVAEFADHQARK